SWKKKIDEKSTTSTKEQQSKVLPYSSLPHSITNLHGSISSTKSSFNDARFNDLKETIEKLERNQEDTKELKRQLKEMENKKNDFEKLYRENDEMLRRVENKLEQEKTEKQRLESTTKNLNIELLTIKQKLQSLQDEKDLLNQRCNKLKEERDNHGKVSSSSCKNCNAFQRSYEQEREYRLQTEQANGRLRDNASNQYQYLNKPFSMQPNNEIYLVENSRKIHSDTERVKSELDRLRQDFDKLVSNYEPPVNFHQQLHSQVDTFRQFYEHEFRQRQFLMSKTTPGLKSTMSQNYHKPSSHLSHKHSFSEACSTCTNSRLLRERLESAIDLSLTDRRFQNGVQVSAVPRQASSLLTINTINNGPISSREFLRERYYV
ncbi:unnamed protein product, partial [Rotaria magnacalcarata]